MCFNITTEAKQPRRDEIMNTVYARVNPVNGKIVINDQGKGADLECSDETLRILHKWGYSESLKMLNFHSGMYAEMHILDRVLSFSPSKPSKSEF